LINDRRYRLEVRVRLEGQGVSVNVFLDSEKHLSWQGPHKALLDKDVWMPPRSRSLGLFGYELSIVVHTIDLRVVSDRAVKLTIDYSLPPSD
jgi:hypothetical protein